PTHYLIQKSLRRRTSAEFEPSERDIGELSQPPSTEIRSVTPPPSHALGHQCVRDVEMSPGQEFQPDIRRDAPTRAGGRFARESHAPPSPPDVRRSHRSRPPSVRRREAAAASSPCLRRHRDHVRGRRLKDVWASDATLLVRAGVHRRLDLRCYLCGHVVHRRLYHRRYLRGRGYIDILY
ncbi:hypothetical protein IGI04_030132, partial [Brassica rapa subsp. trilocularis]